MSDEGIFTKEREQLILKLLNEKGRISVSELEKHFGISGSTARRHLNDLQKNGMLIRTYGGAISNGDLFLEESVENKSVQRIIEKKEIAMAARKFINDGDIIMLGGGTTILELAKLLNNLKDSIVITDSILTAVELYKNSNIEVQIVGGIIRSISGVTVGPSALKQLETAYVDKAFIGADSISIEFGITTPNPFEAEIERILIKQAKSVFVLADNTKFQKTTLSKQASLNEIDYIITNSKSDKNYLKEIKSFGIQVVQT